MTNPIEVAVAPLKADAIAFAEKQALDTVARIHEKLAAAGWDLDVAAPRGDSMRDSRNDYLAKNRRHNLYAAVTEATWSTRRPDEPDMRKPNADRAAKFVKDAKELAAVQYDLFVAKLTAKIGAVETATLDGNHVWGLSHLTVAKADGMVERWRTRQIYNVSKLGLHFPQWPSRKVK